MPDLLDDTWHSRDLPVLVEVVRRLDPRPSIPATLESIANATGLTRNEVEAASFALEDGGYVTMERDLEGAEFWQITGRARRAAGTWPTPEVAAERMLAALDNAISTTTDPEARTRLEKFREGAAGVGTSLLVGVTTAMITGHLPQ